VKTGLFWFLHRLLVGLFWCLWLGVAAFVFQHRAALEPAVDMARLWWHRTPEARQPIGELSGRVVRIHTGSSVQVRDDRGWLFNYGLAGVEAPRAGPNASPKEQTEAKAAADALGRWVLGTNVVIAVTLANPQTRTGLGLVRTAQTNVNEAMLGEGHGRFAPGQIRGLPLKDQYRLQRAERYARERRLGVWNGRDPT